MAIEQLSWQRIEELVGTRHAGTGIEYPSQGMQPYYHWLVRTLHLLAESAATSFRVTEAADAPTSVYVAPGRASIADVVLVHDGGTIDVGAYNNDTAYVWLEDESGNASIVVASAAQGWPENQHIKLAEVALEGGRITHILDRRFETMLRV